MKKAMRKSIEISFLAVAFLLTSFSVLAQPDIVEPGSKSLNPAILHTGEFVRHIGPSGEIQYSVERTNQEIKMELRALNDGKQVDSLSLTFNAKTMLPIRENHKDKRFSTEIVWEKNRVKISRIDDETRTPEKIEFAYNGKYFWENSIDYIISMLPLSLDYRASIPTANLEKNLKNLEYKNYRIVGVDETMYQNLCHSESRDVWLVKVKVAIGQDTAFRYYTIDKKTRRILKLRLSTEDLSDLKGGTTYVGGLTYVDKETDVNPLKTPFNAEEAMAMLKGGTSIIQGQAWTTDGGPKALLGRRKKQYAPKGSVVVLFPLTEYYKEWSEYNIQLANTRSGCLYPLPKKVREASIYTDVKDDKGNFSFQGLKSGYYAAMVSFVATKYSHTTSTPNGVEVTFYGDGSSTSQTTYDVTDWGGKADVTNFGFVNIKKDGETVKLKLDK
jgi:hypothetical protein